MDRSRSTSNGRWKGLVGYLGLTYALSWGAAWLLQGAWRSASSWGLSLLIASGFYLLTMGWQPLVAVWWIRRVLEPAEGLDLGIRPALPRFFVFGALAPVGLTVLAVGVAWVASRLGLPVLANGAAVVERGSGGQPHRMLFAFVLMLAFAASVGLVWLQSLSEEIGWRGYFLTRLMQQLGPLRGLLLHGFAWGAWYAPVTLIGISGSSVARGAGFVVTCMLLGALLGWLRLASRSILPAVVANSVLTAAGGLPLLLQGFDVGLRGAAYGPPGWLPMAGLLLAILLSSRWRRLVDVPGASEVPLGVWTARWWRGGRGSPPPRPGGRNGYYH